MSKEPYTQTYANYYKEYFNGRGRKVFLKAREKYWASLRAEFPGVGVHRASKMRAERKRKEAQGETEH